MTFWLRFGKFFFGGLGICEAHMIFRSDKLLPFAYVSFCNCFKLREESTYLRALLLITDQRTG